MTDGISRRTTFEKLRREGTRVRGPRLSLTYTPLDAPRPQIAFAIPRKVGSAVVRNRNRRRVRAALDERARSGALRPGAYLVHVPSSLDDLDATALRAEVDDLLRALDARLSR